MIYLAVGESVHRLVFTGPGAQAPFAAVSYPRVGNAGDAAEESLDLGLEGSPTAILEGLAALERWLEAARTAGRAGEPAGIWVHLKEAEGEASLASPLLDGWVERLSGQRSSRSMAVRLHLKRANYWEDPAMVWLPLSNLHGQDQVVLQVDNRCGAAHSNAVEAWPDESYGGLPMPVVLRLENTTQGDPLGSVYVYRQVIQSGGLAAFGGWLEGEAASGGTPVSEPTASAGAFNRLSWSGTEEMELCSWQLSGEELALAGGRFYQPLLRFHTAPLEDTRLWMKLKDGDFSLWESTPVHTTPGEEVQTLGCVQIPPGRAVLDPLQPLSLVLLGRRLPAGSHTLDLDALQLAPLEGWRRLVPLAGGVPAGGTLTDDSRLGFVYRSSPLHQADYAGLGPPLLLQPGERCRLVFMQTSPGGAAPVSRSMNVSLGVCRRFRRA